MPCRSSSSLHDSAVVQLLRDIVPCMQAFGMRTFSISGYEADDVIGTLIKRACDEGMAVVLISPDKVRLRVSPWSASQCMWSCVSHLVSSLACSTCPRLDLAPACSLVRLQRLSALDADFKHSRLPETCSSTIAAALA